MNSAVALQTTLPILIPLAAGALSLIAWRSRQLQRGISIVGTGALLFASVWLLVSVYNNGIQVMYAGNWPAPFGIVLVADLLSSIMVLLTGITGLATALYSLATISKKHEHYGYYPLMHVLLAGVNGAFLTGDIFNLYVWFEVMLVASFALLILGGERAQMEGAIKYVTLNLVSSAIFLSAIGLLYGLTGTLNMADLAVKLADHQDNPMVQVVAMLFLMAFGIKAGAFPLFFWLPASYHTPRVAVSSLFAGLLTKVGVYALFRVFTLIFPLGDSLMRDLLLAMAGATMLVGVLGAAAQFEFRRILSFHIISQIGYMLMGLALYTPLAIIGGVFYIIHHIIVKSNLFLISGLVYRLQGSYDLKQLGGVWRSHPMIGVLFLIPALSLAGLPPLSGFFGKFIVIKAGIEIQNWWLVGIALLVGLLTLYSMIKIWAEVFWKAMPEGATAPAQQRGGTGLMVGTIVALASLTILIGIAAEPVYKLAEYTAAQLLDSQAYIQSVMGVR